MLYNIIKTYIKLFRNTISRTKMVEKKRKKPIATNLDSETMKKLKALAEKKAISVAAVVRQAILRFLQEEDNRLWE